jgi:hypothetical protein
MEKVPERLTAAHKTQEVHPFDGTQRFVDVFTRARQGILSYAS